MDMSDAKRDRSPLNGSRDQDDHSRDRNRERSRRGDRPSRFGPRNSNLSRDRSKNVEDRRIFISNIAYETRWQDLKDLFRKEVGEVSFIELFTDDNDKPRGCGIVEFEDPESVPKAIEKMHRHDLKGRKLVVKEFNWAEFDQERNRNRIGRDGGDNLMGNVRGGGSMRGGAGWDNPGPHQMDQSSPNPQNKWGNTYGLSPQFLESLWISGQLVTRVFVANLDYKVDEKKLREVFRLAGKVLNAEISMDREGKSRGFGVIEYEHPVEAVQAISMLHNQMLFNRKLTVRMDRVDKIEGPPKLPDGLGSIGMGLGAGGAPLQDVIRNLPSQTQQQQQPQQQAAPPLPWNSLVGQAGGLAGAAALAGTSNLGLNNLPNNLTSAALSGLAGNVSLLGNAFGASTADIASYGQQSATTGSPFLSGAPNTGGFASNQVSNFGGPPPNTPAPLAPPQTGGFGTGASGRDFDNLSITLNNPQSGQGSSGSAIGGFSNERDFRSGPQQSQGNYPNGSSRSLSGGGGGGGSNNNRVSDTVLVKNLPLSITWQALRDKFNSAGDVKYAEIRNDVGVVRFASEWDAERAIRIMDRSRLDGRTIDVCLY